MFLLIWMIFSFFMWVYLHEYAHLLMLSRFKEIKGYIIRPYPHKHKELGFVYGSVSYDYEGELTEEELAWVSIAPRFANMMVLPCALFIDLNTLPWLALLIGGVVDLLRGSMTGKESADIRRYSEGFDVPLRALVGCQLVYALVCLLAIYGRIYVW